MVISQFSWWYRKLEEKENFYMKNILTARNRSKNIPGTYEGTKAFWKAMKSCLFDCFGQFRCCWIQIWIRIPNTDPDPNP